MNRIKYPLRLGMRQSAVADLQDALEVLLDRAVVMADNDTARRKMSEALERERTEQTYGAITSELIGVFQSSRQLGRTGEVDAPTAAALNALLEEMGLVEKVKEYRVDGRVASSVSASVDGLRVVVVDKFVGGEEALAEATTDGRGNYQATFPGEKFRQRGKEKPDLEVRAFSGQRFLAASEVRYNATTHETLHVVLDDKTSRTLRSEYDTLTADLAAHYSGDIGKLEEAADRRDVTYLANKSGWDARAVALAALAEQFSARTAAVGVGVEAPFFYALFRSGLPANANSVYRVDPKAAASIWGKSIEQGVIPATLENRIPATVKKFLQLAAGQLLESEAQIGPSTFKELITISLGDDADRHKRVAALYTRYSDDRTAFWEEVQGAFGEEAANQLRVGGELAHLTVNNAPLIRKLHGAAGENGLKDTAQLPRSGFYRADRWRELIGSDAVPAEITGGDEAEKLTRYAELLAAKVRLSFPTAVVAEMVRSGETPVADPGTQNQVAVFLHEHSGDFEIGMQPIAQYVARNDVQLDPGATQQIAKIQRIYQITPGDEAMNGLLRRGVDSAHEVASYKRSEFVRTFGEVVGGEENARLIHAKAQQVHVAVLNIAVTFLTARGAPGIGVHSDPSIIAPSPSPPEYASDVLAYATLESLFGELDYCACEHCRSVLSPAAYLVDLLYFMEGAETPDGRSNPQSVLLDRRPDIQHIPLTCENTNTPIPYIDLVNETLEYFVWNGLSLDGYEGHNTDSSARPDELLASPHFVDEVSEAAYHALSAQEFPAPLPFHQPLENLRRYFDRFGAPLPEAMESLRIDDSLDRATATGYGWRDIWMETVGLSRAEHRLLTERSFTGGDTDVMLTVKRLYGFDESTADADVRRVLDNAKQFCRRVGITYEQLAAILRTRFVNPHSDLLPRLERLGVSFETLHAYKVGDISDDGFERLRNPGLDPAQYGGDINEWVRDDEIYARAMSLLTLTNPTDTDNICNFDDVELRYAGPDLSANNLLVFEFVRIIRFIRLWRKLGWSIEQTDTVLSVLYPADRTLDDPIEARNLEQLDEGLLELLPRLGIVLRSMQVLGLRTAKDLLPLLACFAPIDTHGESSLYRQLFLGPPKLGDAFAGDNYGNYLTDPAALLLDHANSLRAACSLSPAEFNEITTELGYDAGTGLTLEVASAIFRRGWLARTLRLSVRELLLLIRVTGYDPFEMPDPVDPAILRLAGFIDQLRARSVKPEQALYLIWNEDLSGRSAPEDTDITTLARTLRRALEAVATDFAVTDDPDGSITRARMALVYGDETTDLFFGLLDDTFVSEAEYAHAQPRLEQPIVDAAAGRIAYDDFRKRLSHAGVLDLATRDALTTVPGVTPAFQVAVERLYARNQAVVGPYFARYPELRLLYESYTSSSATEAEKRAVLRESFLPALMRRRKVQQALQLISAAAGSDIGLADALLADPVVLHAADDDERPATDDLVNVETAGLSVSYFSAETATGRPDLLRVDADLDYTPSGSNPLPPNTATPGAPISGVWSGYLEAPENASFNLRIDSDATATVTVSLDGAPITPVSSGGTWRNATPIELRAGTLHEISVRVDNVRDAVSIRWERPGSGAEIIPARYLYAATLLANVRLAYVRLLKTGTLATTLGLTAAEMAHFASHADYAVRGEGWLNRLPVTGRPGRAVATTLLDAFFGLLDFSRIKADHSPSDERLLRVLRDPEAATADAEGLLFALTRWEPDSLNALLGHFRSVVTDLAHVRLLARIYDAHAWVRKLGIPASSLIAATTNEPTATAVQDLQGALRARYDRSSWLDVLRPINDEMRSRQRDALVAYVLHGMGSHPDSAHIDTPEKLFEYFLIDVQMDPCMLTSRIRYALSSVQLFIERCLLNLESRVSPASIRTEQWEWMKRYRVWEANRKVFLYPENWLEPELRDDQSPFFKETMSELLQGDITEDRAAQALVGYLTKLEGVAKLEICGVHYEEHQDGTADDVVHVVGRTAGANRKYFYRRREHGSWTPWEKVNLDIEDNPVLPLVWNNRLFLFWLKLVKEMVPGPLPTLPSTPESETLLAGVSASAVIPDQAANMVVRAILHWTEFLGGKWQPTRTSDPADPLLVGHNLGHQDFDRSDLALRAAILDSSAQIDVTTTSFSPRFLESSGTFEYRVGYFELHNAFSTPEQGRGTSDDVDRQRHLSTGGAALTAGYSPALGHTMLTRRDGRARVVQPEHSPLSGDPWDPPFFYENDRHAFYVTTDHSARPLLDVDDLVISPDARVKVEVPGLIRRFEELDESTEDGYIDNIIRIPGTVTYGDREIDPSGSRIRPDHVL